MMKTNYYKRKIVFIQKEFQINFIIKFTILVLIALILSTLLIFLLSKGSLTAMYSNSRLILSDTSAVVLSKTLLANFIILLVLIIVTVYTTLYVSHKIGGPLYRFSMTFKAIETGDLTKKIVLREKDQLKNVSEEINNMMDSLSTKVNQIKKRIYQIKILSAKHDDVNSVLSKNIDQLYTLLCNNFVTASDKTAKILIVVDDDAIRLLLSQNLSAFGHYDVDMASNGIEAAIKLGNNTPDILLLDIYMPEMNGVEVCKVIKQTQSLNSVKVIIITGDLDGPDAALITELGFDNILSKPIDITKLIDKVDELLLQTSEHQPTLS